MTTIRTIGCRTAVLVSLCLLAGRMSHAGEILGDDLQAVFHVEAHNPDTGELLTTYEQSTTPGVNGDFVVHGDAQTNNLFELEDLSFSGNVDPVASLAYGVKNVAAIPVAFTLSLVVPVPPQGPSTLIGGSTGGSVTDADATGGASAVDTGGLPFYSALIDGSPVLTLHTAPFSFSTAAGSVSIPSMTAGLPGPTLPGPAAAASIAIVNDFTLSPGDSLSATNVFQVTAIPEPASALLCVLGMVGVISAARPRRR